MKKIVTFILFLLISISLISCENPENGEGKNITDDLGRTVMIKKSERVACLLGRPVQHGQRRRDSAGAFGR